MIIDVNTYLGHWPFRNIGVNTAEELSRIAEKNCITHMLVSSLNAVFYKDCMQGNLELLHELKEYRGKTVFIPFAVINPTYPAWEDDLVKAVTVYGFKGIELCPLYHNYPLSRYFKEYELKKPAADAFKLAGELGVPVRILSGFENFRQRHHMDVQNEPSENELIDLIKTHDSTTAILNGFNPVAFGETIRERTNIFFDITAIDTFLDGRIEETISSIGDKALCFGSMTPFRYPEVSLTKVMFAKKLDKEAVLYRNIAEGLGNCL